MPKRYREDSLYVEQGRCVEGWLVKEMPFPEMPFPEMNLDGQSLWPEVIIDGKKAAVKWARSMRRIYGGCWHVLPLDP